MRYVALRSAEISWQTDFRNKLVRLRASIRADLSSHFPILVNREICVDWLWKLSVAWKRVIGISLAPRFDPYRMSIRDEIVDANSRTKRSRHAFVWRRSIRSSSFFRSYRLFHSARGTRIYYREYSAFVQFIITTIIVPSGVFIRSHCLDE